MVKSPIVIIADDLSGAAELAGIAFARGYTAEVQRQFDPASEAEVVAVDTHSRGLAPDIAADRVRTVARAILAARPAWIFKKVDSILRGNVRAEMESLLEVTRQRQAMLIPANPSRGRTIVGGRYFVDDVPLHETNLANDPEHPRSTSLVADLISADRTTCGTISVPDVSSAEDLRRQTSRLDEAMLPAGAADFFAALLDQRCERRRPVSAVNQSPPLNLPALLICGSRTAWPQRSSECLAAGVPVRSFPPLFASQEFPETEMRDWAAIAARRLSSAGKLLVGIGTIQSAASPAELLSRLASLTALIREQTPAATLLLEGGATAAAVVEQLGWSRFAVAAAAPAGIGILQPIGPLAAPRVWIKPGSYPWPDAVWASLSAAVPIPPPGAGVRGPQ